MPFRAHRHRSIDFVSVTEPFDTTTPQGQLLFHITASFAEFERELLIERTKAGPTAARRRGKRVGRPRVFVPVERARSLMASGLSMRRTAKELGVGFATLHRALRADSLNADAPLDTTAR